MSDRRPVGGCYENRRQDWPGPPRRWGIADVGVIRGDATRGLTAVKEPHLGDRVTSFVSFLLVPLEVLGARDIASRRGASRRRRARVADERITDCSSGIIRFMVLRRLSDGRNGFLNIRTTVHVRPTCGFFASSHFVGFLSGPGGGGVKFVQLHTILLCQIFE